MPGFVSDQAENTFTKGSRTPRLQLVYLVRHKTRLELDPRGLDLPFPASKGSVALSKMLKMQMTLSYFLVRLVFSKCNATEKQKKKNLMK